MLILAPTAPSRKGWRQTSIISPLSGKKIDPGTSPIITHLLDDKNVIFLTCSGKVVSPIVSFCMLRNAPV